MYRAVCLMAFCSVLAAATAAATATATAAAPPLNQPSGLAWDGAGNLYISETAGCTIRKLVSATGMVTTLAGSSGVQGYQDGTGTAARFHTPARLTLDGAGSLYVADGPTIRRINALSGAVTTFAGATSTSGSSDGIGTAARFFGPSGVAWDGAGSLYVADSSNHTIRKISLATSQVTTVAGTAGVSGFGDGTGAAAMFKNPGGIAADPTGLIWVADTGNNRLRQIVAATGEVTTIGTQGASQDGVGAAVRFQTVQDVASDLSGTVFVADSYSIRKLVVATRTVTTLAGGPFATDPIDGTGTAARFVRPLALTYDPQGALFVTDRSVAAGWIRKVNVATQRVTTGVGRKATGVQLGALPGGLNQPHGVAAIPGFGLAINDEAEQVVLIAHGL